MNLSAIAIKRPVFTVMVTTALLVLGLMGLSRLGTDLFPDVAFPVVAVNVVYPGASPGEVETQVTKRIEDAVVSINGVDRVRSFSRESLSTIVVQFKLSTDIKDAAREVDERVSQVKFLLPKEAEEPRTSRIDVGASPILTYTLQSPQPLNEIRKYADDVIRPTLEPSFAVATARLRMSSTLANSPSARTLIS